MEPMKSLRSGLPASYRVIMDQENCFHVVPLHTDEGKAFATCYHWKILPQGMANSFTLCEKFVFVSASIQEARTLNLSVYIIHGVLLQAFALTMSFKILGSSCCSRKDSKAISFSIFGISVIS